MEKIRFFNKGQYTYRLLKKKIKNFAVLIFPDFLVKKIMEYNYTDYGSEISNACNANCSFCAYRFQIRKKNIVNFDLYKKTIDEYSEDGGGKVSYTPVVGDPLVDKNLLEKVKYARSKKNINGAFLYTNALFFDRYKISEVVSSGLTRIAISTFFGDKELYKKYYGVDGYERVVKNIIDLAKENNLQNKPIYITLHLRVEAPESRWVENKEFKEIVSLVGSENVSFKTEYENWSGMITDKDLPTGCTLGDNLSVKDKSKEPCWELYRKVYVMSDGRVGVCPTRDLEGEIEIGNSNDEKLIDIWRGDKIKEFKKNWVNQKLPKVCVECDRYRPISSYIRENKYEILKTQFKNRIFRSLN